MDTFESFLDKLKSGQSSAQTLEWYLGEIRKLAAPQEKKITTSSADALRKQQIEQRAISRPAARKEVKHNVIETTSNFSQLMIGKMVFFKYDAKTKDKLPYWDQFPLIFPFRIQGSYTLGMNMHYLPPVERARLMYSLYSVINSTKLDTNSRLLITYKVLNESTKYVYFKPCIKKYLTTYIRSRLMIIDPKQWNNVLMMPLANFMKASEYKVWDDSLEKIRKAQFST